MITHSLSVSTTRFLSVEQFRHTGRPVQGEGQDFWDPEAGQSASELLLQLLHWIPVQPLLWEHSLPTLPHHHPPPRTHAAALPKWTLNGALASPTGEPWLRPFGFWSREPGLRLVPGLWRLDPCHGLLSYHKVDTASLLELGHSGDTEDTRWGPHESWQHWAGTEGLPFPHGSHGEPAGRMLQEGPVSRGFSEGSKARWEGVRWEGVRCLGRTPRGLQSLTEHCAPYPSLAPGGPWCRRPTWPSAVTASTSASPRLWGHSEVQFL